MNRRLPLPDAWAKVAKRVEIPQTTMSRHLLDLGEHNRKKEPGLGLVTSRPGIDARRHEYFLTERGRLLRDKLETAFEMISRGEGRDEGETKDGGTKCS
jgi:DNA-binding MarR family transcriptional regulator